jgi:hypothetical protein
MRGFTYGERAGQHRSAGTDLRTAGLPLNVHRRLVFPQPNVTRVAQEVVGRPGRKGDLGDQLWLDPMDPREDERRSEACLAGRQHVGCGALRASGSRRRRTSASTVPSKKLDRGVRLWAHCRFGLSLCSSYPQSARQKIDCAAVPNYLQIAR